jgi:hypothetical protein
MGKSRPGITAHNIIKEAKAIGVEEALAGTQADTDEILEACAKDTKALQERLKEALTASKKPVSNSEVLRVVDLVAKNLMRRDGREVPDKPLYTRHNGDFTKESDYLYMAASAYETITRRDAYAVLLKYRDTHATTIA